EAGVRDDVDPWGRSQPRVWRRLALRCAVRGGARQRLAGDKNTVFAAVRGETTQAVGEKKVRRQLNRLIFAGDALLRHSFRRKEGASSVGPIELVGQRAAVAN